MAFISLLFVVFAAIVIVLIVGRLPIVIGTILYHKTSCRKLGVALSVFGYIVLIPVIVVAVLAVMMVLSQILWVK